MANVLETSARTYRKNAKLILFFSIAFLIAMLIPVFAPFPTYDNLGAIFIRTGSIYLNLNFIDAIIIVAATMFSLLFLSLAIVSINVIVKHSHTATRIRKEVISGLERYTANVFVVLLVFTALLVLVSFLTYYTGYSGIVTLIAGIILIPFLFYAPTSIVMDDARPLRAVRYSIKFVYKQFKYFLLWVLVSFVLLSVVDIIPIAGLGSTVSVYLSLVIDSFIVLPFLIVLQSETYIRRFSILKHT
ncbi:MAG: hypothetical protein M1544_03460 [Candidatus Marsarchaeota archaeon]|nr:hypothetical protein [Candidatus Marsarchaeota archaeon]MCL5102386.1 hypothetical protein [Candidatus Marsarchaeota archaeon]